MNLTGFVMVLVRGETVTTRQMSEMAKRSLWSIVCEHSCDLVAALGGEIGQEN